MKPSAPTIDAYIAAYPKDVQRLLEKLRKTIAAVAPKAEECLCYGIPTFKLNGNLVHFGAYKTHIGFYPSPSGIRAFAKQLKKYKQSKGAVQFPLDEPLPLDVVKNIVLYRILENEQIQELRSKKKKKR